MVLTLRKACKFFEFLTLIGIAWVGFALDLEPSDYKEQKAVAWAIKVAKENAAPLILYGAVLVGALRLLAFAVNEESPEGRRIRNLVEEELEKLRDVSFPNLPSGEPPDNNRITSFERVVWHFHIWPWRGIWPWGMRLPGSGWLVSRYRSGHTTQNCSTCFLAPDDADQNAEGVAGQTWRRNAAYRVRNLPNLQGVKYLYWFARLPLQVLGRLGCFRETYLRFLDDSKSVTDYASSTSISASQVWKRLKRRKKCPLSMCGVPIEDAKGRVWGVLVLDSSNGFENVDTNDRKFKEKLRTLVKLLHKLEITEHYV